MTRKLLTQTEIFKIKLNDKKQQFQLADKLFLIVHPSRTKVFRFSYRSPETKQLKRYNIGNPDSLSLNEVKKIALEYNLWG